MTNQFRFGVGQPQERRSTIWKVWTTGEDAYIQSRMMGSSTKVSIHKDGRCQWSFTSEWYVKNRPGKKNSARHIVRWRRPETKKNLAAFVFRIVIPTSELRIVDVQESLKTVTWLSAPPTGRAQIVECYVTPPGADAIENYPFPHLTSLELSDSKFFVLLTHEEEVNADQQKQLQSLRDQTLATARASSLVLKSQYRGVGFFEGHQGERGMIEFVPLE